VFVVPEAWTYDRLLALVKELSERNAEQARVIAAQGERIAELERRLAVDSSNSSRPPSSDAPWDKQPAKKRSSRSRSGRKPGKQPGSASASRSLIDDPDETFEVAPDRCAREGYRKPFSVSLLTGVSVPQ
jgi:transposase